MDAEYDEYLNDLNKLEKIDLIEYISDYWKNLRNIAENQLNDEVNIKLSDHGRLKMTEVSLLKIRLRLKTMKKS